MTRVNVLVEGQSEESFVNTILAPTFWPRSVFLTPIVLGRPGHKGGRTNYARVRRDLLTLLKQDRTAFCSTMFDFYGLGRGFPGTPPAAGLPSHEKASTIEQAVKDDILAELPDARPDVRLLPYIQVHEYEGLLFSDPEALATGIGQGRLAPHFRTTRNEFPTPEDIDDDPVTAPSKRIIASYPGYRKVIDGTLAAREVGIVAMRRECPHFRQWVEMLEALEPIVTER